MYPVGLSLALMIFTLLMIKLKREKLAFLSVFLAFFILYMFSITPVSTALVRSLEMRFLPIKPGSVKASSIVVLGGPGRPKVYPRQFVEFGEGGERIFDGIRWWKSGSARYIITSGGGIDFIMMGQKEGDDLKALITEFGVPENFVISENKARNTYENAIFVRAAMIEKGMPLRIVLITSAIHMPRSYAIFKKAGFDVIPAPTDYIVDNYRFNWFAFMPRADNIHLSTQAIKEFFGIFSYWILGWL